jgi:hypothetical protein
MIYLSFITITNRILISCEINPFIFIFSFRIRIKARAFLEVLRISHELARTALPFLLVWDRLSFLSIEEAIGGALSTCSLALHGIWKYSWSQLIFDGYHRPVEAYH